jgi:hypothetical protein
MSLSPDGKWALTFPAIGGSEIVLLPTGPGESKHLPLPNGFSPAGAQWFPDGKRLLLAASERGHGVRLYEMELGADLSATLPRPFSPEGVTRAWQAISPDGRFVVATHIDGRTNIYSTVDGVVRPAAGVAAGERPIRWSDDPQYFYTQSRTEFPSKIYRVEFGTGRRQLWKEMIPLDPTGIRSITAVRISQTASGIVTRSNRFWTIYILSVGWDSRRQDCRVYGGEVAMYVARSARGLLFWRDPRGYSLCATIAIRLPTGSKSLASLPRRISEGA